MGGLGQGGTGGVSASSQRRCYPRPRSMRPLSLRSVQAGFRSQKLRISSAARGSPRMAGDVAQRCIGCEFEDQGTTVAQIAI